MIFSALTSITFRNLSAEEIIALTAKAKVNAIEWGGDVHVPHGKLSLAREVRKKTVDAGINICSYGSYYFLCHSAENGLEFSTVLETALELGTKVIRIWPGKVDSADADEAFRESAVNEAVEIAKMAKEVGVELAFEYHLHSLTDTTESTLDLLNKINSENVKCYWQPFSNLSVEENLEKLEAILPWLKNVHVFQWREDFSRLALSAGQEEWGKYFKKIFMKSEDLYAAIEFVKNDSPEQFISDAKILKQLIGEQ